MSAGLYSPFPPHTQGCTGAALQSAQSRAIRNCPSLLLHQACEMVSELSALLCAAGSKSGVCALLRSNFQTQTQESRLQRRLDVAQESFCKPKTGTEGKQMQTWLWKWHPEPGLAEAELLQSPPCHKVFLGVIPLTQVFIGHHPYIRDHSNSPGNQVSGRSWVYS